MFTATIRIFEPDDLTGLRTKLLGETWNNRGTSTKVEQTKNLESLKTLTNSTKNLQLWQSMNSMDIFLDCDSTADSIKRTQSKSPSDVNTLRRW